MGEEAAVEKNRDFLREYMREWHRSGGRTHFPYSNLTIPTSEKTIPYVHSADQGPSFPGAYNITASSITLDGNTLIEYQYPPSGSPSLDHFLAAATEILAIRKVMDPYSPSPLQELDDKVNAFLRKHASITYPELAAALDVKSLTTDDFSLLGKVGLKRRLFDFRAKTYLAALASTEERGFDLQQVLQEISEARIFPLKKEQDEPTFTYILGRLNTH